MELPEQRRWVNNKTQNLYIILDLIYNANNDAQPNEEPEFEYQRADVEKDPRKFRRKFSEFYQKFTPYTS